MSYIDDEDDEDYQVDEEEEAKKMIKETKRRPKRGGKKRGKGSLKSRLEEKEEEDEDVTVGDVFKLEMELNRENKKMMKVRKRTKVISSTFFSPCLFIMCLSRGVVMAASYLRLSGG